MNTLSVTYEPVKPLAPSQGALRTLLWVTPLLGATVLSKFAVPPFGAQGISITLPLLLAATLLGCFALQFQFDIGRLMFGAVALALLGIMQILKSDVFSLTSLVLVAALHLPYIFRFREPAVSTERVLKVFVAISLLCAVGGILQFVLQRFIESKWLYPIDSFMPTQFLVQNYNEQAPLEYGSKLLRANGIFLMEPSYLSQLLAIAVVIELSTRNRWWYMLAYLTAMVMSYSGTGFIVLAICIPVVAVTQRRLGILVAPCVVMAATLLLGNELHLDSLLSRINEFTSTGSSGFARFVGGFYLFDQFLWSDPVHALLGVGAGMFKVYAPLSNYPVAEMPLFKMVLEFGLSGALLYFVFLFYCLKRAALPAAVTLAIGLTYLLNGLYVPFSHAIALSLLVWTSKPALQGAEQREM